MKIAVLQSTGVVGECQKNLARLEAAAQRAHAAGAALLVTPELFVSGYDPLAVHAGDGASQRTSMAEIAATAQIALVGSTVEADSGHRYISASLFDSLGREVTRYRKQHLFGGDESLVFRAGTDAPELVHVGEFTAALGICFDIEFPEFAREQALRGADLLLIPTAVPLREERSGAPHPLDTRILSTIVVPARAFESQLFIAYANQAGAKFSGHSTVADPYGRRLVTAGDGDELIFAELDSSVVAQARSDVEYLSYFK